MSVSIYYTAFRPRQLSADERKALAAVKEKYSVNGDIEAFLNTGKGLNWESFTFYDPPLSPGAILEGSTKIPDNSEEASWIGIQHWCKAISELRRQLLDAEWEVRLDDLDIPWDADRQIYDIMMIK